MTDVAPIPTHLPHRPIRVHEWHQMVETGVFGEDEHLELLEGEIVQMPPRGPGHGYALQELAYRMSRAVGDDYRVRVQLPLTLGDWSEPEPDLAVVHAAEARPGMGHPRTALLVVEVADSSLRADRGAKLALYARHAIPEVWIAVVARRVVEVHRDPDPSGVYRSLATVDLDGEVQPLLLPGVRVAVRDLFAA